MANEALPCEVFNLRCTFESSWVLFKWFKPIPYSSPESSSVLCPSTLEGDAITNLPTETNSSSKSDSSGYDTSRSFRYSSAWWTFMFF